MRSACRHVKLSRNAELSTRTASTMTPEVPNGSFGVFPGSRSWSTKDKEVDASDWIGKETRVQLISAGLAFRPGFLRG